MPSAELTLIPEEVQFKISLFLIKIFLELSLISTALTLPFSILEFVIDTSDEFSITKLLFVLLK